MTALLEKPGFILLLVVVVLLFGAKRLPEVARGVGRSLRILKAEAGGLGEDSSEAESAAITRLQSDTRPPQTQTVEPPPVRQE